MDHEFWHERWREDRIGFHEGDPNALLLAHFDRLQMKADGRVFVPFCGKAVDLDWLLGQGFRVVGIELNQGAVEAAFERMGVMPARSRKGRLVRYMAEGIEIYCGDFFDLSVVELGSVDAIYDRAALVALPKEMRNAYGNHLAELGDRARQLLISFDYDQSQTEGPPFSVPGSEIEAIYASQFRYELLASRDISGPLANRCTGLEQAWLLTPKE